MITLRREAAGLLSAMAVVTLTLSMACGNDSTVGPTALPPAVNEPSVPATVAESDPAPTVTATLRPAPVSADESLSGDDLRAVLLRMLDEAPDESGGGAIGGYLAPGLDALRRTGDPRFVPILVDMLGIPPYGGIYRRDLGDTLDRLTGESIGPDWFSWVEWVADHEELAPPPLYAWWKGEVLARVDPRFQSFLPPDGVARTIRLEEIVWGGVKVDAIPSLDDPVVQPGDAAAYLDADEQVFGVTINGEARAYPLRIMNWHEMTNDVVGGVPVSLAYCTLCNAAILFDTRRADSAVPYRFHTSGLLYRSNKLMYDADTNSLWNQFTGRPVVGPLTGQGIALPILPVTLTTWGAWRSEHPDTTVLSIETGYDRPYLRPGTPDAVYAGYFSGPDLLFPAGPSTGGGSLLPKSQVFVVITASGDTKAYQLEALARRPVVNDAVGETPVVLVTDAGGGVQAYERGDATFSLAGSGEILDHRGRVWHARASGLIGPESESRSRLSGHVAYWFAYRSFRPGGAVWDPAAE